MTSVQEHYRRHLGPVYGWMLGEFADAVEAARGDLRAAGLRDGAGRTAVDLGAGLGAHAIALAEAGYAVTAIDNCAVLLDQLRSHDHEGVTCVLDDLTAWRDHTDNADAVMCMGDTLTHLPDQPAVAALLQTVALGLKPGGVFLATFRDYGSAHFPGEVRFIPVKSDPDRILTCILEYQQTTVTVNDVLHERRDGTWTQRTSSYSKLRLSPDWIRGTLEGLGLQVMIDSGPKGMVRLLAVQPE